MAEARKSCLDMDDEKAEKTKQEKSPKEDEEFKEPVACTSSDVLKDERPVHSVSSTPTAVTSNIEMTYLDKIDRKVEKKKQENSSEKEPVFMCLLYILQNH